MYNQQMGNGYPQPVQNKPSFKVSLPQDPMLKNLTFGLIGAIVVSIIGCFLPYMTLDLGYLGKTSYNFISNSGELADGIFIIICGVISIVTVLMGKYLLPVIAQGIATALMVYKWVDFGSSNTYGLVKQGIGFWIILLAAAVSCALAVFLYMKTKKGAQGTTPAPAMPMGSIPQAPVTPQPQVQNKCPYCGAPKTGGDFCPSCGAKY